MLKRSKKEAKMRICRICLAPEDNSGKFFDFFDKRYSFPYQLNYLTNISIVEFRGVAPALICIKCKTDLSIAYKLKKVVFEAEKFFNNLTRDQEMKLLTQDPIETSGTRPVEQAKIKTEIVLEELPILDNFDDSGGDWQQQQPPAEENADEENFENDFYFKAHDETDLAKTVKKRKSKTEPKRRYKKGGSKEGLCHICWKNLWSTERLQNHIRVKHEIIPVEEYIPCPIEGCNKRFKIQLYVDRHVENIHNPEGSEKKKKDDSFPCSFCGILLKSRGALRQHENRHEAKSKPEKILTHFCDICGYRADKKIKVQYHIERVHLHLRKHKCRQCSADFVHKSLLQYHEWTVHLNLKKFVCRYNCGKSFTRSYCRTIHERIHTNERPYSCRFCDRTFIHHSDWRRHELRHTGGIPVKDYQEQMKQVQF